MKTLLCVIFACFLCGSNTLRAQQSIDQGNGLLLLKRTVTQLDISLPDGSIQSMYCPAGYLALRADVQFIYGLGTAITAQNRDDLYATSLLFGSAGLLGLVPLAAIYEFHQPTTGTWTQAVLLLVCADPATFTEMPAAEEVTATGSSGTEQITAYATCTGGKTVLGGNAYFENQSGAVVAQWPATGPGADPFAAPIVTDPPGAWGATGKCRSTPCRMKVTAACGKAKKYATLNSLKAGGSKTASSATLAQDKLSLAPGVPTTLSLSCSGGWVASAVGAFGSDSAAVKLIALSALTPGTPYSDRGDGLMEGPQGWRVVFLNSGSTSAQAGMAVICVEAPSGRANVVEFYNTALGHYFRTASTGETEFVTNGGAGPGWVRNNEDFKAYMPGIGPGNDVCRFYNPTANTHFYTANPGECTWVKTDPGWTYEGLAFRIEVPNGTTCPSGTVPVYRNYNNRHAVSDPNHRFSTNFATYDAMIAQGWPGEGVVMCAVP